MTAIFNDPNDLSQLKTITVDYNATPVTWETDAIPVIGSTVLFGAGIWAKRKFAGRKTLVEKSAEWGVRNAKRPQ